MAVASLRRRIARLATSLGPPNGLIQPSPNPAGAASATLSSISCTAEDDCMAVGSYSSNGVDERTLERRKWTRQPSPSPAGANTSALNGVSCLSSLACTAVGGWSASSQDNPAFTLAEQWNGTAWAVESTPNPAGAQRSTLLGVDCLPEGACAAAGDFSNGSVTQTLIERYSP